MVREIRHKGSITSSRCDVRNLPLSIEIVAYESPRPSDKEADEVTDVMRATALDRLKRPDGSESES